MIRTFFSRIFASRIGKVQPASGNWLQRPQPLGKGASALRPVLFCFGTSAAAFTGYAILEENRYRHNVERLIEPFAIWRRRKAPSWQESLPGPLRGVAEWVQERWASLRPEDKAVYSIIGLNTGIFLMWRVPGLQPFLYRYFVHRLPPLPNKTITLLTSNFCHLQGWHLAINMIAFVGFGKDACRLFGLEQFLAFYISAGLASGLVSHLGRLLTKTGGMSVGASGAIYACFAATAISRPDAKVSIIFLPFAPFEIGNALPVMICLDVVGILAGWRAFDHWGHLGGALFGIVYTKYGPRYVWPAFEHLAERLLDVLESENE